MIAASRRRRPGIRSADETFRLHDRLARRSGWSRRLIRGSVAALVVSLLALLVGAGLVTHAILLVAAFLVAVLLPVPGQKVRALSEIRARVGLSYETALDLMSASPAISQATVVPATSTGVPDSGATSDPYGFRAAVVERARVAVADVKPAPTPAWWLPALAVAAALLLVSSLELIERPAATSPGGTGGAPSGSSVVTIDDARDQDDTASLTPPDEAPGRAEEPESGDENRQDDEGDSGRDAPPPLDGDGDSAPMSRFLDSLRERPPESGGGQSGQDEAGQGQPQTDPPGQGEPGAGRDGESERVDLPAGADDQDGSDARAAAESGEDQTGEDGESTLVATESDADGESEPSGEQQGDEGEGQGGGEDQQAENQPTEGGGDGEQGLEAGGAADGESSEDPSSDSAAGGAAGPESAAGVAEGEGGQPEFLQGVLGDGPESPAGAVRLPGQTDVTLPPGAASPADYAAAAEEALSEGDLPLSYQEIIRRYFR